MIQHPRCTIQRDDHTDDQKPRRHDPKRISIRQADGEDGGCKLPRRSVKGVGEPVGYEGIDGPLPVGASDGVEIWV